MSDVLNLTPAQIAFFHENGFLTLPAITTPDEVAALCDIYDHLFEIKAGRDSGDHLDLTTQDDGSQPEMLPQILNPSKYAPALVDTQLRRNAEAVAKQLLGHGAVFQFDHAIRKPARSGVDTPWHQDEAYNDPSMHYENLSIWIPLQEATLENGCMQFVPGSQKQGVIPHQPIGNDPKVIGLEVQDLSVVSNAVACELAPGGATIHHCRTLHYTGPNTSAGPRRAYIVAFGTPPVPRKDGRDFPWLRIQQTAWQARAAGEDK
jgi:ectoine hydroxylase-related dioxygenase (phytanoyl-CoA dioxygenase family)